MPIIEQDQQQHVIEREEEIEDREWVADREEARRVHELNLAKIKSAVPQRHKTITRVGLGVVKIPALMILSFMLPLLVLAHKDIPEVLSEFLSL
jgi:hypothetical protein